MDDELDILDEIPEDDDILSPLSIDDRPAGDPDDLPIDDLIGIDDTHPVTDTNLQTEEEYDEGLSGAAEAKDPVIGSSVIGYDPSKDQRRKANS
jgi:hypothetical protein